MAVFQTNQPATMLDAYGWSGNIIGRTSSQITVSDGQGGTINYTGTFKYDRFNNVTDGLLTGYTLSENYVLKYTITDLAIPGASAYTLIQSGDTQYTLRAVLNGADRIIGSIENDVLGGFAGNDTLIGGIGNDICYGGTGNDVFVYTAGNDTYFGQEGVDRGQFNFNRTIASITSLGGENYTIELSFSGTIILLNSLERLAFLGNQIVAFDSGVGQDAGEAFRMYQAAFNRTPDPNGLAGWINYLDHGGTELKMAEQFILSDEFQFTYGSLNNTAFVQLLYNNVLHRDGEANGVRGWVNALNEGMSRAEVLYGFSESRENIANVAPLIANGINYTEWWLP